MSDALRLALIALAVYRVSCLLALEDGPFDILTTIREKIDPEQKSWIGRGVRCVLCISFWLSLVVFALGGSWLEWLSVAGGVSVIYKIAYR